MSGFYSRRSQEHKKTDVLVIFFVLLASMGVKATHKMLVKSTPGVNFINILLAAFTWSDPKSVRIQSSHQYLLVLLGSL